MRENGFWQIAIDTGGTFTDCLARRVTGQHDADPVECRRIKILSSGAMRGRIVAQQAPTRLRIEAGWLDEAPSLVGFRFSLPGSSDASVASTVVSRHEPGEGELELRDAIGNVTTGATFEVSTGEPAPVLAARLATRTPLSDEFPPIAMRLATTRGTNALLERNGARIALFINEGLADLIVIGDQQRPELFALNIQKPQPIHECVVEVSGRIAADGSVHAPLDLNHVRRDAAKLVKAGVRCAAVALMHSYRNPDHERAVADVLREEGFAHVACSAALAPLIEILPRAETAVVDSYLAPVIKEYLAEVKTALRGGAIDVMTSAGGLVRADRYRAKDSLLSGPAGGVAGAAAAGRVSGFDRIIGFDMGGTSTDVSRYDGDFEYRFEHRVGSVRLVAPALAIETVAAGGGSICGYRDGRLFVGPDSARADPGPACYGAGGPLTLTDVNLLMGRLDPDFFEVPIDPSRSEAALDAVLETIRGQSAASEVPARDALLEGFLAIANEHMAGAIRQVSLRRGYDPADYALVSFGGAGGQHACAIASLLGMKTVVMPSDASLLSAVGLSEAVVERFSQRQVLQTLDELGDNLEHLFEDCAAEAASELIADGVDPERVRVRRRIANARLLGQDATIAVEVGDPLALAKDFNQRYEDLYGHRPEGKPIEVESIRVVASSENRSPRSMDGGGHARASVASAVVERVRARVAGDWRDLPAYRRGSLIDGQVIAGPALIFDRSSTYVIEPGWVGEVDHVGAIVLRCDGEVKGHGGRGDLLVELELFANRFASVAEEMGQMLQRTALSTNVKRRLDFSCAVLDADGQLIVNAPHIPVHLGALGLCVRAVAKAIDMRRGDVLVTNHPAYGGSHLPDVTVITPVFDLPSDGKEALLGYVANRAHHAEIGGSRPGSMPPDARTLVEEGVVIPPMHLVRDGRPRFGELESLLRVGPCPSRAVEENLADLRAAVAANHRGVMLLQELARRCGRSEIARQMQRITDHASTVSREAIRALGDGEAEAVERLDDGSAIAVKMQRRDGRMTIDLAGSAPQHPGNLNTTPAVVRSAVLYVLRLLMGEKGESAGLNEGIMHNVDILLPRGMLNPNFEVPIEQAPAVVGGNVETSQRLVDALLKPLGIVACSQGTMNNVLFGNERFGYYETVCGGCGAGPTFDGAHAVHSHMTNTRITDPEILEHRYPVRLERFAVRRGSGGAGRHRGGDGVVREMRFLESMSLSILSQHRVEQPYGLEGGTPGASGRQGIVRHRGETMQLRGMDSCEVEPGDRLILETPGGGGFGSA